MKPAVFIDRDGTILRFYGYARTPFPPVLIDGASEGIRLLRERGFFVFVITNQSGIGRGLISPKDVEVVNWWMEHLLLREGAGVDGVFYSPDPPWVVSKTRKPGTGLIDWITSFYSIDLEHSWIVGDKMDDILLGRNAGIKSCLVLTGEGEKTLRKIRDIDLVFPCLKTFAEFVVEELDGFPT